MSTEKTMLQSCESEPIRVSGMIQPFGTLLLISNTNLTIQNASENCEALLGISFSGIINRSLHSFFSPDDEEKLREHLSQKYLHDESPLALELHSDRGTTEPVTLYGHKVHNGFLVEIERDDSLDLEKISLLNLNRSLRDAVRHVQSSSSLQQLLDKTVLHVRNVTGFDRVMVYRFSEDWHGHVVAESKGKNVHSYLNHHFPASDIPAQARQIFLENWIRMIPDVDYVPVAIFPAVDATTGSPIDLGRSSLRSVSPIHIEYLKNMGVKSTISLPLIKDNKLWGLIACHHNSPRLLESDYRQAAISLAQLASSQLEVKKALENQRHKSELEILHASLLKSMEEHDDLVEGLISFSPNLLDFASADGVALAVYYDSNWTVIGATPSIAQIEQLVEWLSKEKNVTEVFSTNALSSLFLPAKEYIEVASGVLAIAIPKTERNFILWFRPQVAKTITWAGEPAKRMVLSEGTWRFHPRFSFESWLEIVNGVSLPWKGVEIDAAKQLRTSILALDLKRAFAKEQAARAQAEKASIEKESMIHIVSHDIRNPLAVIKMSLQIIANQDIPKTMQDKLVARSQKSTEAIERLVTAVLDLASITGSKQQFEIDDIELNSLVREIVDLNGPIASQKNIKLILDLSDEEIIIKAQKVKIEQIFGNLISNALKFTPTDGDIRLTSRYEKIEVVCSVEDTGPGISADLVPRVFDRFVRGESVNHGAGLGLAIVKETVESLGGKVRVEPGQQSGAKFIFTIPLKNKLS